MTILAAQLAVACILAASVLYLASGLIVFGRVLVATLARLRSWLVLRRVTADLLGRDRASQEFCGHLQHRGLHAKPGEPEPLSIGEWR